MQQIAVLALYVGVIFFAAGMLAAVADRISDMQEKADARRVRDEQRRSIRQRAWRECGNLNHDWKGSNG